MFVLWCCWSYCGELSSKRPSLAVEPEVETRLLSGGLSMETTLLLVRLLWVSSIHSCHALVDSGVEGNFLDSSLTHHLQLPIFTLQHKISVNAFNGQNLPFNTHTTGTITLITSGNHSVIRSISCSRAHLSLLSSLVIPGWFSIILG